ncbi:MAG: DNA repair protein RadC [Marinicaulis sp.]|nr:DNA repair protein RadC [Marinicaulis sp.]
MREAAAKAKPQNHAAGQWERLRERYMEAGVDAFQGYEFLEMILFRAILRRDVKPLAKELINTFGGFAEVIAAPVERLKEIKDVSTAVAAELKIVQASAIKLSQERVLKRPILSSWTDLLANCRAAMADEKTELFRILFLDKKNILIADEVQQRSTVEHTPVYPRKVGKRALELGASAMNLVHNYPSGDPAPMSK